MDKWIDVVTQPLGLAGFALFLVFAVFTGRRGGPANDPLRWLLAAVAVVALAGGLSLSYLQMPKPTAEGAAPETPSSVNQTTGGTGSPAIANVKGNVSIGVHAGGSERKDESPK